MMRFFLIFVAMGVSWLMPLFISNVSALTPPRDSDLRQIELCEASGGETVDLGSQIGYPAVDWDRCRCPGVGVVDINAQWPGCPTGVADMTAYWVTGGLVVLGVIITLVFFIKFRQGKLKG